MLLLKDYSKAIRANAGQLRLVTSPGEFYMLCRNICELARMANFARAKEYRPSPALLNDIATALKAAIQEIKDRLPTSNLAPNEDALVQDFLVSMTSRAAEIMGDLEPTPASDFPSLSYSD